MQVTYPTQEKNLLIFMLKFLTSKTFAETVVARDSLATYYIYVLPTFMAFNRFFRINSNIAQSTFPPGHW